jgi:hypothetical protein
MFQGELLDETCHCLSCSRSEEQTPLIALQYAGGRLWICPQCLPVLIHHADQMADKLAEISQHTPAVTDQ